MSKKKIKNLLLTCGGIILISGFIVFSQQNETSEQKVNRAKSSHQDNKKIMELFRKVSSEEPSIDQGNQIVAIRRINFHDAGFDKKNKELSSSKKLVEIELFSKLPVPLYLDCCIPYAFVGSKVYEALDMDLVNGHLITSTDARHLFIRMSQKDFDELKGGEIVSVAVLGLNSDQLKLLTEKLSAQQLQGEIKDVQGAKFGRIDKV